MCVTNYPVFLPCYTVKPLKSRFTHSAAVEPTVRSSTWHRAGSQQIHCDMRAERLEGKVFDGHAMK